MRHFNPSKSFVLLSLLLVTACLGPRIDSFTPTSGAPSQVVRIQGGRLSDDVEFNGVPAAVISSTSEEVFAVVPTTADTGPIRVTNSGRSGTSNADFTVSNDPLGNTEPQNNNRSSAPQLGLGQFVVDKLSTGDNEDIFKVVAIGSWASTIDVQVKNLSTSTKPIRLTMKVGEDDFGMAALDVPVGSTWHRWVTLTAGRTLTLFFTIDTRSLGSADYEVHVGQIAIDDQYEVVDPAQDPLNPDASPQSVPVDGNGGFFLHDTHLVARYSPMQNKGVGFIDVYEIPDVDAGEQVAVVVGYAGAQLAHPIRVALFRPNASLPVATIDTPSGGQGIAPTTGLTTVAPSGASNETWQLWISSPTEPPVFGDFDDAVGELPRRTYRQSTVFVTVQTP